MTYRQSPPLEPLEYVRDGVGDLEFFGMERTGVTHLVHAWHQQGRKKLHHHMTPSKDITGRGTSTGAMEVKRYFRGSRPVAIYLSACFEVAFPDYFVRYQAAFKAGVWTEVDPGPLLGRAIVWKLPVKTHMDGLDDGPTAIFNVGQYTGGELYLPDLEVKLQYDPGSLVILLSGLLYHSIGEWEPTRATQNASVTPGRVGNVFFFPKASLDKLEGKKADWNVNTMTGTLLDVQEKAHR